MWYLEGWGGEGRVGRGGAGREERGGREGRGSGEVGKEESRNKLNKIICSSVVPRRIGHSKTSLKSFESCFILVLRPTTQLRDLTELL